MDSFGEGNRPKPTYVELRQWKYAHGARKKSKGTRRRGYRLELEDFFLPTRRFSFFTFTLAFVFFVVAIDVDELDRVPARCHGQT